MIFRIHNKCPKCSSKSRVVEVSPVGDNDTVLKLHFNCFDHGPFTRRKSIDALYKEYQQKHENKKQTKN